MQKINLVKAIVRHTPVNFTRNFVQGAPDRKNSVRYLLLKKAEDKFFPENIGKWEFVGGVIKPRETSKEAIAREMKEETGLEGKIVRKLPTLKSDKSICEVYLINANSMDVKTSAENSDYRWLKAEDIKKQDLVLYASLLLEFFNNPEKYLN